MLSAGFVKDAGKQILILPLRQKAWNSDYRSPRKLLNGHLWALTCYQCYSLSLLLAGLPVAAAVIEDDGNSVFEMRSRSIRNKPAAQQNSPDVWSRATDFSFHMPFFSYSFSFSHHALFSISQSSQKECQGRSWSHVKCDPNCPEMRWLTKHLSITENILAATDGSMAECVKWCVACTQTKKESCACLERKSELLEGSFSGWKKLMAASDCAKSIAKGMWEGKREEMKKLEREYGAELDFFSTNTSRDLKFYFVFSFLLYKNGVQEHRFKWKEQQIDKREKKTFFHFDSNYQEC